MLEIIPARRSFGADIGRALGLGAGKGLEEGMEIYEQRQKQKQFAEAIGGLEELYKNPNLSESQKLLMAYKQLSKFPDVAQQLGGQLSRLGASQRNLKVKCLRNRTKSDNLLKPCKIFKAFMAILI